MRAKHAAGATAEAEGARTAQPYRQNNARAWPKQRAPLRAGAAMQARVDAVRDAVEKTLAEFDTKAMRPLQARPLLFMRCAAACGPRA